MRQGAVMFWDDVDGRPFAKICYQTSLERKSFASWISRTDI